MRRLITILALPLSIAACQGTTTLRAPLPFAAERVPATSSAFSKPNESDGKGPPSVTWIFASNGEAGNVDVYNAKTLKMISQCPCAGVGLAVNPTTGDLAVATKSATVTVWHVKSGAITQFATLNLSEGPYSIGLAFNKKGDLYAGNAGNNVIDYFSSSEIEGGGGAPVRTLFTSHLTEVYYVAATTKSLVADGPNLYGQPILVSVNRKTGADTILQNIGSGHLPEGIVFDLDENLIANIPGTDNTLAVYKKPWTGPPASTFVYGSGETNGYYTGISLNQSQHTLWAASYTLLNQSHAVTSVQANSYPLGSAGRASTGVAGEFYDGIAVDPQAK